MLRGANRTCPVLPVPPVPCEGLEGWRQRGSRRRWEKASVRDHVLLVAEAAAETSLEGRNMALAIFIPVLIISLLLGGAYIYITR